MKSHARPHFLCLLFWLPTLACGAKSAESAQSASTAALTGRILDEAGRPISGAAVEMFGGATTHTDTAGAYALSVSGGAGSSAPLTFSAAGFASAQRAVVVPGPSAPLPDVTLRAIDKTETVSLPAVGGAAAVVTVAKRDGQVSLILPAGGLIDAAGAAASGDVEVSLTYWHPQDLGPSMPGFLAGIDQDGTVLDQLRSYGMADVSVAQNGSPLEVAPGAGVELAFTVSAVQQKELSGLVAASWPSLFHLDPSVAQWREVARMGDPNLTYVAETGVLAAQLPHFSQWNADGGFYTDSGGCVSGQVLDGCTGKALPNQPMTLWLLSFEELTFFPGRSDGSGNWCITTSTPNRPSLDPTTYLVTGATMAQTNQDNPLPQACRTCTDNWSVSPTGTQCNRCRNWPDTAYTRGIYGDTPGSELGPNAAHWYGFYGTQSDPYGPAPSPSVAITPCSFCPQDRPATCRNDYGVATTTTCAKVDPLIIPGPGCACVQPGVGCTSNQTCCIAKGGAQMSCQNGICAVQPPGVPLGMPCGPQVTCVEGLICGDGICIPPGGT